MRRETPGVRSLVLEVEGWPGHRAGQHVDIRLTAEDGYQAQRSYSIASAPGRALIELTVEAVQGGEVSSYLIDEVGIGDRFELRGPIGGFFVWSPSMLGPLVLIGGGSGIAPLMAMLRHRAQTGHPDPALLVYSSRSRGDIIYRDELERLAAADASLHITHALTRERPAGWPGYARRIDGAMLAELNVAALAKPNVYVCGPTGMVEAAARALVALGLDAQRIRTERFGPSGG